MRVQSSIAVVALALSAGTAYADPDRNVQIMAEAARQLSWDYSNKAYFLVKQETVVAPVAVIFGYGNNADACERLAYTLSQPQARAGTFECVPIY